jgi:hypothetical protein
MEAIVASILQLSVCLVMPLNHQPLVAACAVAARHPCMFTTLPLVCELALSICQLPAAIYKSYTALSHCSLCQCCWHYMFERTQPSHKQRHPNMNGTRLQHKVASDTWCPNNRYLMPYDPYAGLTSAQQMAHVSIASQLQ